ncbi:MAG: CBS domain-containing protein [Proteobacteria bacterium]|nr:CBS domain-containing protein [Pseudomonadota bacterium]
MRQHALVGSAVADQAAAVGHSISDYSIIERAPVVLTRDRSAADAAARMLDSGQWGIPVVDEDRRYLGMCTVRSLLDRALILSAETLAAMPRVTFLRDDFARIRKRLGALDAQSALSFLDDEVPTLSSTASLTEGLLALCAGNPVLPVIDAGGDRFVGLVTWERVVRSMLHAV